MHIYRSEQIIFLPWYLHTLLKVFMQVTHSLFLFDTPHLFRKGQTYSVSLSVRACTNLLSVPFVYTVTYQSKHFRCESLLLSAHTGETEPARRAAECEEAHPLLLLQHRLLPAATSWPQGGHQPVLWRQADRWENRNLHMDQWWRVIAKACWTEVSRSRGRSRCVFACFRHRWGF